MYALATKEKNIYTKEIYIHGQGKHEDNMVHKVVAG